MDPNIFANAVYKTEPDWEGAPVGIAKALAISVVLYGYHHVSVHVA